MYEGVRDHSPLAKKINDHFQATLREIGGWQAKRSEEHTSELQSQ